MKWAIRGMALSLWVSALAISAPTRAQESAGGGGDGLTARAVQERRYFNNHEFTAYLGALPFDAFTKGITLGGSYTIHFDELVGWEVLHGAYSFPVDTRLRSELDALDISPTPFEVLQWYATSALVISPIYWKAAWLNDSLLHGEFSLIVGAGYGRLTRSDRAIVELGLSARFFASDLFSVRLDLRYLLLVSDTLFRAGEIRDELWVALGVSLGD